MTKGLLENLIKTLPQGPGIYLFKDGKNSPLYIGKALNLKKRLASYLKTTDTRILKMIEASEKVSFMETGSDIEALILEARNVKEHNPPFNIMLRDDKQYFFVGFSQDKFPRLIITHQPPDKSYIGPFTDGAPLKATLKLLRRIFPYCTCKQKHNNFCLNYHIGKCLGFCCLKSIDKLRISDHELRRYEENIKATKDILSGKRESLIREFEKEMEKLAEEEKFEKAMELKAKIAKLRRVFENAKILSGLEATHGASMEKMAEALGLQKAPNRIESYDVANIQGKYAVGAMTVFENGRPNKNEYRKFKIYSEDSLGDTGMLREVIIRRFNHPEWKIPDLILIDGGKGQLSTVGPLVPKDIPLISIAKNERHMAEKVYIAGREKPLPLSKLPLFIKNILLQINSETHRFTISYYRKLHRKTVKPRLTTRTSKD